MNKFLFFFAFFIIASSVLLFGQNKSPYIAKVEGNIDLSIVCGTVDTGYKKYGVGNSFGGELRYNFQKMPFDVGVGYASTRLFRHYDILSTFSSWNIYAVSDYTFRQMKRISFFVGVGVGCARQTVTSPIVVEERPSRSDPNEMRTEVVSYGDPRYTACIIPRVGVEFWHRLRITCSYYFEEKVNQHFQFSIACAIGGGVRG